MRRPIQVYFEEREIESLERWSRRRGWTKSQAVRAAVRALTASPEQEPLLELAGMVDGLPPDSSENFDRYLDATFVAERAPAYAKRPRVARARARR
jgi:hypothetical protein